MPLIFSHRIPCATSAIEWSNSFLAAISITSESPKVSSGQEVGWPPTKAITQSPFTALIASAVRMSIFSDGVEV